MKQINFSITYLIDRYKKRVSKAIKENDTIRDEVAFHNINRLYYTALVAIPVSLAHVFIFWYDKSMVTENGKMWRMGIILSHILLIVIMAFFGLFSYYVKKKKSINIPIRIIIMMAIIAILLFGVSVSTIDQLVTSNVTPFLIACTIAAVVFLMRPFFAAFIYGGTFLLYYKALELAQLNEKVLLSNRVNGITAVGIGFCLSIILWKSYALNFRQKKHIEMQQLSLGEKNQELLELNQLKDKIFTVITHDIREPLATMVSLMELLEEDKANLSKDSSKIIEEVRLQISRSYTMIDSLLDWCRQQRDGLNFKPSSWELYSIVHETVCLLQNKACSKDIEVINNVKKDIYIVIDREVFDLVLRNILTNAIKFTAKGGSISIEAFKLEEKVIVAIEDTGVGINLKKIQDILTAKKVSSSEGTAGEKGMGLGLGLCREFLEPNDGDIWVDSKIGKGSTFYISVPRDIND